MEVIEESIFPEKQITYAGFGERFGAVFIDRLVLMIPSLIVMYGTRALMQRVGTSQTFILFGAPFTGVSMCINFIIRWLYFATLESGRSQATIGKKLSGIRVTTLNGDRLSFPQASARYFGKLLSTVIIFAGYFMMNWHAKKQTLHDKIAGTVVIKTSR